MNAVQRAVLEMRTAATKLRHCAELAEALALQIEDCSPASALATLSNSLPTLDARIDDIYNSLRNPR